MAKINGLDNLLVYCSHVSSNPAILEEIKSGINKDTPNRPLNYLYHLIQSISIDPTLIQQNIVENTISPVQLIKNQGLTMVMFIMGKGASFPIHDHTEMLGITHILYGKIWYKSYDLVSQNGNQFECRVADDRLVEKSTTLFVTPERGNLHEIYAEENCIVFDIFIPSYFKPCNYYRVVGNNTLEITRSDLPC